jgi:RNA polymerase sigma factor (sigma-70 family)
VGDAQPGVSRIASAFALARAPPVVAHGFRPSVARSEALAFKHSDRSIDDDTRAVIRRKVRQIVGRAGFHRQDREDLQQAILVRVFESVARFDPARGHRNAFVTVVVDRYGNNLVRQASAQRRDPRRVQPIDPQRADVHADQRRPRSFSPTEEQINLAIDVSEALRQLPDDLRAVAEQLMHHSLAETTRSLNLTRSQARTAVRRLRIHLKRKFGFSDGC